MLQTVKSTLTRPANTTAYAQNDLIADNTTAGNIVVPSLTIPRNGMFLRRIRLHTDKTSGMGSFEGFIEFWTSAPTFTNGDNGAYAVATGAANWIGAVTTDAMTQVADGAYVAAAAPTAGTEMLLRSGALYWTLKENDSTGFTPASGQTFTLHAELIPY